MASPASIGKHPIHPMLIVFPLGLWVFSLICDIIFLITGTAAWSIVAVYTLGAGIVGAIFAVIPGVVDFLSIHDPDTKRLGVYHLVVNAAALVIFVMSFFLRFDRSGSRSAPIILSALGVVLSGLGGWFGGEMVYIKGMGVEAAERREK